MDLAAEIAGQRPTSPDRQIATTPPSVKAESAPLYDPSITSLIDRLMAQKRKIGITEQMIEQMTKVFLLFSEATEVTDIRQIRQAHIAKFIDTLDLLPISYRKSPKDRFKPLAQILAEAEGKPRGLSPTTIGRNLDYLGQLLTKARSEGFSEVNSIDLGSLRPRKSQRDRDDRPSFTAADVQSIFMHPVWHGRLPKQKWQMAGPDIIRDGLYWVPAIAALTGARREEIAGLKAADIASVDGIMALKIHENSNRRLKTLASARTIPLHPQLIEIGLPEFAARMQTAGADADLFPDLKPALGSKFGEQIDYRFRLLVQKQLAGNPQGKVFHSFRHYVATELGKMPDILEKVRKDILGHTGGDITSERYTEQSSISELASAIARLPRLSIALPR